MEGTVNLGTEAAGARSLTHVQVRPPLRVLQSKLVAAQLPAIHPWQLVRGSHFPPATCIGIKTTRTHTTLCSSIE